MSHAAPGTPHLCIGVDDVDARYERLAAAGYRVSPVVEPEGYGFRSFYVKDPDGMPVELLQRLAPSP